MNNSTNKIKKFSNSRIGIRAHTGIQGATTPVNIQNDDCFDHWLKNPKNRANSNQQTRRVPSNQTPGHISNPRHSNPNQLQPGQAKLFFGNIPKSHTREEALALLKHVTGISVHKFHLPPYQGRSSNRGYAFLVTSKAHADRLLRGNYSYFDKYSGNSKSYRLDIKQNDFLKEYAAESADTERRNQINSGPRN